MHFSGAIRWTTTRAGMFSTTGRRLWSSTGRSKIMAFMRISRGSRAGITSKRANASQTKLNEVFLLGITDPTYKVPCQDQSGNTACAAPPYDLTRGTVPYGFRGKAAISQVAWFGQDSITFGDLTLNIGLRYDYYNGLTRGGGPEPRGAFSYLFKPTKTEIRGGYTHSLQTPVNENLLASSSTGSGGLPSNIFRRAGGQPPLPLGSPNQHYP